MFHNVLVGVDHHGSADAVALAKRLLAGDGRLTLAYIFHGRDEGWRGPCPPVDEQEERRIFQTLRGTADAAAVDAELTWHGASTPGRGLHELAEGRRVDLLVVGSSRRGLFGRVLLGDDTRGALNGAPCAVAIAPAGYAADPGVMREIGIAYNGSPESCHALQVGRSLAVEHHSKLSAFEAVEIPAFALGSGVGVGEILAEVVTRRLQRVARPADHRVAGLRPARADRARRHRPPAHPHRAVPAPGVDPRRPGLAAEHRRGRHFACHGHSLTRGISQCRSSSATTARRAPAMRSW